MSASRRPRAAAYCCVREARGRGRKPEINPGEQLQKYYLAGLLIAIASTLLVAIGWWQLNELLKSVTPRDRQDHVFAVAPGQNCKQIAWQLKKAGLIKSAWAFLLLARLKSNRCTIRAGFFTLSPALSAREVLAILTGASGQQLRVTVPEGYDIRQIAALLAKQGVAEADELLAETSRSANYLERFPWLSLLPEHATLEGFLFPDTYALTGGRLLARNLVTMMLTRFEAVVWPQLRTHIAGTPLSPFAIVTLASMVEREAYLAAERPLIAGVFLSRLRIGMPLASDPTVEYALGRRQDAGHPLTTAELRSTSPYNTYRYKGLPPGPIANPGLASLQAVLSPVASPYRYFVARGDGSHQFSRSYREQLAAQQHYQRR
ncbi:MAG: endolytic transglycosylase MltG [Cyanobacteria bacterium NC_groundwater_1444_Ag_S-0.65um_54_12]|nr:endolytic transglycosylase MltG [Cyanobacteria bacterium NC_groundwater_1444_Ag_S-0.65um_54_12]